VHHFLPIVYHQLGCWKNYHVISYSIVILNVRAHTTYISYPSTVYDQRDIKTISGESSKGRKSNFNMLHPKQKQRKAHFEHSEKKEEIECTFLNTKFIKHKHN